LKRKRTSQQSPPSPYRTPLVISASIALILVVCVGVFLAPEIDDKRLLGRGNEKFREGLYDEAAALYEEDGVDTDLATRRYNAGVALRRADKTMQAIARFEKSSLDDSEELRMRSCFNLGNSHFDRGYAAYRTAYASEDPPDASSNAPPRSPQELQDEQRDARLKALHEAAGSFATAIGFYRRIDPPTAQTRHNIEVAKTARRQSMDEILRIEEERRKEKDDEAIREPATLLPRLIEQERMNRAVARAAAKRGGRGRRLASRRLRKAQAQNRSLTERLLNYLKQNPDGVGGPPGQTPQPPSQEDKKRHDLAIATIARAVDAQQRAEIAYTKVDIESAGPEHSTAISELRNARVLFPLDPRRLAQEALSIQRGQLEASRSLDEAASAGLAGEVKGSGFGKTVIQALKDKVLQPLVRLMTPSQKEELELLGEEEDEVIWSAGVLASVTLDASHFAARQGSPQAPPGGAPQPPDPALEQEAKEVTAAIRAEAEVARRESTTAKAALLADRLPDSISAQEKVITALEALIELFPKPPEQPKDPVEELKELIARQQQAESASEAADGLEGSVHEQALAELSGSQEADGAVAREIAQKLAANEEEPASQEAAKDVEVGRDHVEASALGLEKASADGTTTEGARSSIARAVAAFEKALEKLEQDGEDGEDQQQDPGEGDGNQDQVAQNRHQGGYSLTPRQAQALKEEMDKKRRETMQGVYTGPRAFTVEKDW